MLVYIHRKQIVHRDLKPENILISHNGGNVKVIDFGFSDSDNYAVNKVKAGTAAYTSPEMLAEGGGDSSTDIYSLGVIIREMGGRYRAVAAKCCNQDKAKRYADAAGVEAAISRRRSVRTVVPSVIAAAAVLALLLLALNRNVGVKKFDRAFEDATELIRDAAVPN